MGALPFFPTCVSELNSIHRQRHLMFPNLSLNMCFVKTIIFTCFLVLSYLFLCLRTVCCATLSCQKFVALPVLFCLGERLFEENGKRKKGNRAQRKDLWAMAGGMDALVKTLKSINITSRDTDYSSAIWSELSVKLFGQDLNKKRNWLWVIWTRNRNGVRDFICKQQENSSEMNKAQAMEKKITGEDTEENKAEANKQDLSSLRVLSGEEQVLGENTEEK